MWTRWRLWLGKKDQYGNGKSNFDDRTRMELLIPQSTSGGPVSFFTVENFSFDYYLVIERKCNRNRRSSINN